MMKQQPVEISRNLSSATVNEVLLLKILVLVVQRAKKEE
jgi:hypothetical protein